MRSFFTWLRELYIRKLSDSKVQRQYVKAGGVFGDAVSYGFMGECVGLESLLDRWARWEKEYASRGYRTLSIDSFIEYGGYGTPLRGLGVKRKDGEQRILHAEICRAAFLHKISPSMDLKKVLASEAQSGTYVLPSTKDFSEES